MEAALFLSVVWINRYSYKPHTAAIWGVSEITSIITPTGEAWRGLRIKSLTPLPRTEWVRSPGKTMRPPSR